MLDPVISARAFKLTGVVSALSHQEVVRTALSSEGASDEMGIRINNVAVSGWRAGARGPRRKVVTLGLKG